MPFASINADGWSGEWSSSPPPTFDPVNSPQVVNLIRQGFDSSGAARSDIPEALLITTRKRKVYPNHADYTDTTVALSDYAYSTDQVAGGLPNASAVDSPKPMVGWLILPRLVVGDFLELELVAFHRNARQGRQVAAVKFIVTDGSASVTVTVSTPTLSPRATDQQPTAVYRALVNVSTLAVGMITANAEVYPWIGGAASVRKSVDSSVPREFSPRYFLRNPTLFASPPVAYVQTAANGGVANGVVSTNPATAAATPFDSVKGAADAINAAYSATTGIDGAEIRVGAGTFAMASWTTGKTQRVAAITITRDPTVPRASAIVTWGAAAFAPGINTGLTAPLPGGAIRFKDVTVVRTGANFMSGPTGFPLDVLWDDMTLDNAGNGFPYTRAHSYMNGVAVLNGGGGWAQAGANGEQRLFRGVVADTANSVMEQWVNVACAITRAAGFGVRDVAKGAINFNNRYFNVYTTNALFGISGSAGQELPDYWVVQNQIELLGTGSGPQYRPSSDTPIQGNIVSGGAIHNTYTGYYSAGRHNVLYDNDTSGNRRNHKLFVHIGEIIVQLNTKGDVNVQDGTAVGQLAYHHGVGCNGNWTQFRVAAGVTSLSENQLYPGLGSVIGTSDTVRNDPGFRDYRAVTSAAGTSGGDYRLLANAPARQRVTINTLSHDLAGNPRPTNAPDDSGAYTTYVASSGVNASATLVEDQDSAAGTAAAIVRGAAAMTEGADLASGAIGAPPVVVNAAANLVEGADTASATAAAVVRAAATLQIGADTLSATAGGPAAVPVVPPNRTVRLADEAGRGAALA